jgi:hypothetical protein
MSSARILFPIVCMLVYPLTGAYGRSRPHSAPEREPHELPARNPKVTPLERTTSLAANPRFNGYQSVQVNVDAAGKNIVGDAANEPTLAIDPTDPARLVIGWRQFDSTASDFREAGWAYSHDGGQSWTFPGVLEEGWFRSDPVLAADLDGTFFYYSLTNDPYYSCQMFISDDGGVGWTGPISAYGGDKQWMDIDLTGGIGSGNIYAAWDYAGCCGDNWFTRSVDHGVSYMSPIEIPQYPNWGTVAVGPDGALYIVGRSDFDMSTFVLAKSTNAQNPAAIPTFPVTSTVPLGGTLLYYLDPAGPNPQGLLGQVWVAVDHSGGPYHNYIYVLCSVDPPGADPLDVMFTRSTNGGTAWSTPVRVNDDAPGNNAWQWFGTLSAAPNGRIDAVWNDTRNNPGGFNSQLFYSYSENAGATWAPNIAVTPAWNPLLGWPGTPPQKKIGDYYDMTSDDAAVNVAYAATFNGEEDVYFMRLGDCNNNGVHDGTDIASGTSTDLNGNHVPDECEGLGDMNCDGALNGYDIDPFVLALTDPPGYEQAFPNCTISRGDINGDGSINGYDIDPFVTLLTHVH